MVRYQHVLFFLRLVRIGVIVAQVSCCFLAKADSVLPWRVLSIFSFNANFQSTEPERRIKVGLLMPNGVDGVDQYSGFQTSAGAVTIGLERVMDEEILPNTNIT